MAGQDPIGYRDKVSKRRILMAICCVWMVSACLSFPAIIWWRTTSPHLYENKEKCLFTDSVMYVSFSSLVSFYIPLCLILFAYGKVFVIATRHSRGMRMGIRKVKYKNGREKDTSTEIEPTLRIHIGRGRKMSRSFQQTGHSDSTRYLLKKMSSRSLNDHDNRPHVRTRVTFLRHRSSSGKSKTNYLFRIRHADGTPFRSGALNATRAVKVQRDEPSDFSTSSSPQLTVRRKLNVREKSRQMVKYVHEQRAARTLSIVVGAFILCWTPFFVFSPLAVFCDSCFVDKETIFTIVTWAGHLNSMLNPFIYSRFSRDFRRAFKQILTCQREQKTRRAFKTPLSLVFTQLLSVTQMEDHSQSTSIDF